MRSSRLSGLNTLAYMGVEPVTPPQFVVEDRDPTPNDIKNFIIGCIWLTDNSWITPVAPPQNIWMLVLMHGGVATWVRLYPGGGGGGAGILHADDGGDAIPDALGRINVIGGNNLGTGFINMNTDAAVNTLHVSLNKSIQQPATSTDGLEGLYGLGGNDFMHAYGTHNTFLGESAGNRTLTVADATENTAVGFQALTTVNHGDKNCAFGDSVLSNLTEGADNTGFGWNSLHQLVGVTLASGFQNTCLGSDSGSQLLQGNNNVLIGYQAGRNYVAAESNNIVIGASLLGTAAESNKIRVGTQGTHDATYVAGIYHTVTGSANRSIVFCDNTGQLGTGADPANGAVLIGGTNGPQWAQLIAGAGAVITPGDHTITIAAPGGGGGGGLLTADTDGGPGHSAVVDVAQHMTFAGDGIIHTDGAVNTVTTSFVVGATDGQILISRAGLAPVWSTNATFLSGDGSINIIRGAGTLDLRAIGGGGGGAAVFHTNAADANVAAGAISILGADNINTTGAGAVVTVHLDQSILQPNTNAAGTTGLYSLGGRRFLHNFQGGINQYNTFVGENAGNLTSTTAADNTGCGQGSLSGLTTGGQNTATGSQSGVVIDTGSYNSAHGYESASHITSGTYNCAYGHQALNGVQTGIGNVALGYLAGGNLVAANSYNIDIGASGLAGGENNVLRIGEDGAGAWQQNACYVAGIYNRATAAVRGIVMCDNAFKLGSSNGADGQILIANAATGPVWANITAGAGIAIANGAGTITITNTGGGGGGAITTVNGGTNITTVNPAGPIVTVNLDSSIQQPDTNVAGTSGIYAIGATALPGGYITDRFLHNYMNGAGSRNIYLGYQAGRVNALHTGNYNIGIGGGSLNALTDGQYNTCVGYQSGGAITGGVPAGCYNTALGASTLFICTTGSYNTVGGYRSGRDLMSASNNTLYGASSGENITTSPDNTILGDHAGFTLTSGTGNNTAVGNLSLNNITTGYKNTVIGATAGTNLTGAGHWNLYLDSPGPAVAGVENQTIRIGTYATGASAQEHLTCYCAGIHNGIGADVQLVTVTQNGRLQGTAPGTAGYVMMFNSLGIPAWGYIQSDDHSLTVTPHPGAPTNINIVTNVPAFLAHKMAPTVGAVTGNGATYWLGTDAALAADENTGGFLSLGGGGTEARFTAPYTGLYTFTVQFETRYIVVPPPPPPPVVIPSVDPIYVRITTAAGVPVTTYSYSAPLYTVFPTNNTTDSYTVTARMTAGQRAIFGISITLVPAALITIIGGGNLGDSTWVSGNLIKML